MQTLVSLLPEESLIISLEPERVRARAEDLVATNEEFLAAAWDASADAGSRAPIDLDSFGSATAGSARLPRPSRNLWTEPILVGNHRACR